MSSIYEAAFHDGKWGFWCDAYEESDMIQAVSKEERHIGSFIDDEGPVQVMAIGGDRKLIVASLPKTRSFFPLSPANDRFNENWEISWVGHINCFPYPGPKAVMLRTHDPNIVVASGNPPGGGEGIWVSCVSVLPDMLAPVLSCCDL